jgi:hypothetical protein
MSSRGQKRGRATPSSASSEPKSKKKQSSPEEGNEMRYEYHRLINFETDAIIQSSSQSEPTIEPNVLQLDLDDDDQENMSSGSDYDDDGDAVDGGDSDDEMDLDGKTRVSPTTLSDFHLGSCLR